MKTGSRLTSFVKFIAEEGPGAQQNPEEKQRKLLDDIDKMSLKLQETVNARDKAIADGENMTAAMLDLDTKIMQCQIDIKSYQYKKGQLKLENPDT